MHTISTEFYMDQPVALVMLAVVVVAAFVAGWAFGAAAFAAKVEGALKISSALDGELATVISAQLATNRALSDSVPVANGLARVQEATRAHLGDVAHATESSANDAIGAPREASADAEPPPFGSGSLFRGTGKPSRRCTVCEKLRAIFRA